MKNKAFPALVALLAVFGGCARQSEAPQPAAPASVQLVPAGERSRSFERVGRELELGGTLYGYMDIAGDSQKVAGTLQSSLKQMASASPAVAMVAQQDFKTIFTTLGFDDITAMGVSSVPDAAGGFRNRAFFYTPNGRHGLMAALGGPAAPFVRTHMAPADADFYAETEFDLPVAYTTLKELVARIQGKPAADTFEKQLKDAGVQAGFSLLEVIMGMKGRAVVIGRIDPEQTYVFPGKDGWVTPRVSLVVGVEGIGPAVQGALAKSPKLQSSESAGRRYYTLKEPPAVAGMDLVAAVDGTSLYLATSTAFLDECLARKSGLDQNPDFQRMLAVLGPEGNSVNYVTPRFFAQLRRVADLNPAASRQTLGFLTMTLRSLPASKQPLMLIRQNLPDGILVRAHYNRSFKQEMLLPYVYNPLTAGLLAAVIIQKRTQALQSNQGPTPTFPSAQAANIPYFGRTVEPDTPPSALAHGSPRFPPDLRRRKLEGIVVVDFIVDAQGRTRNARAVLTPDPEFSAAAVDAVGRWRFQPGKKNGTPVNARMAAPVAFKLANMNGPPPVAAPAGAGPAAPSAAESELTGFYSDLQKDWTEMAAKRAKRPDFQFRTLEPGALIWARIGIDAGGGLAIEDVGHGPDDPGAAQFRDLLEQAIGSRKSSEAFTGYLREVGHVDIGLPSISDLR